GRPLGHKDRAMASDAERVAEWSHGDERAECVPPACDPTPGRTPSGRCSSTRGLRLHFLLCRDLLADLLERAANQARHVHLRDAHLLCDLRLCQTLEQAKVQDLPLTLVEDAESGREHGTVLRDLVLMLFRADRLERVELLAVLLCTPRRQGQGRVRTA